MAGEPLSKNYTLTIGIGFLFSVVMAAFYVGQKITKYTLSQENFNVAHAARTEKIEQRLGSIDTQVKNMKTVQMSLTAHQTQITDLANATQVVGSRLDEFHKKLEARTRSRWSYSMMKDFVKELPEEKKPDIEVIRARHLYPDSDQ